MNTKEDVVVGTPPYPSPKGEGIGEYPVDVLSYGVDKMRYSREMMSLMAEASREAMVRYLKKLGAVEGAMQLMDDAIFLYMMTERIRYEPLAWHQVDVVAEAGPRVSRMVEEFGVRLGEVDC